MNKLTPLQQRWLAIGLFVGTLSIIVIAVLLPALKMSANYQQSIEDSIFKIQRYKRVISSQDEVLKQVDNVKVQLASQGYFSDHTTVSLASAALQQLIKQSVSEAGGQLSSTQVLPKKQRDDLIQITVKVRLSGSVEMLRSVIYEMETSKPLLMISLLDIRPVPPKRNRKTRKMQQSGKLNINFDVSVFIRNNKS